MKYLVLETHPAYAILLDQTGRFVKAANRHYQVGETVQNVLELRDVPGEKPYPSVPPSVVRAGSARQPVSVWCISDITGLILPPTARVRMQIQSGCGDDHQQNGKGAGSGRFE